MQEGLRNPDVRLVVEGGDLYYVLRGAELRATEDGGWIISEKQPDGSVAVCKLDENADDEWAGLLPPRSEPDAN